MPMRNLSEFLEGLADARQLVRVGAEIDARLELAEVVRRTARAGGPALLFDRVKGATLPIVANLLGTPERACRALGVSRLEELAERTDSVLRSGGPPGWLERLRLTSDQPAAERFRPKTVRSGVCQQIVRLGRDVDLKRLAMVQDWPDETGPAITSGQLIVGEPGHPREVIPVRLVLVDNTRAAVIDEETGAWTRRWQVAQAMGQPLPVAVILGGDPALRIASAVPVSESLDGFWWCGVVRGAPLDLVKCRTLSLEVPAEAEIVLEGTLDPGGTLQSVTVGSAAGHFYRPPIEAPLLTVETITERSNAMLPIRVADSGRGEVATIGKAVERLLLPLVRAAIPELADYALPGWGGDDRFAFLSISKTLPLGARRAASAFWGLQALATTKIVVLVDDDVDVQSPADVWARVGANVDPERDVFFREGPAARDDHAFLDSACGHQMGIDATRKLVGERPVAGPGLLTVSDEVRALVDRRWKEYGL